MTRATTLMASLKILLQHQAVVVNCDVEEALGGLPAASQHCVLLATDTLLSAIGDALGRDATNPWWEAPSTGASSTRPR